LTNRCNFSAAGRDFLARLEKEARPFPRNEKPAAAAPQAGFRN
jgi:hypothetical protein